MSVGAFDIAVKSNGKASPLPQRPVIKPSSASEAWPDVPVTERPTSYRVLVQMKRAATVSKGGLYLPDETVDADKLFDVYGKVRAIGPAAFADLVSGRPFAEAPWFQPGDIVRVPVHGGVRVRPRGLPDEFADIEFRYYNDRDVIAVVDPSTF